MKIFTYRAIFWKHWNTYFILPFHPFHDLGSGCWEADDWSHAPPGNMFGCVNESFQMIGTKKHKPSKKKKTKTQAPKKIGD